MERNIENREWKQKRINQYRKRCVVSICINTVVPTIFILLATLFNFDLWILIPDIVILVCAVILNYQTANRLQNFSQSIMVYKLTDETFTDEWNDYVTTVDFTMNREYQKKHK